VTTSEPTRVDTKQVTTINAANYAAGIIGAAALRTMFRDPASAVPRFAELADLITKDALGLATLAIGIRPTDVAEGYGEWAQFYDQPNPAIAMEEPHVHRIRPPTQQEPPFRQSSLMLLFSIRLEGERSMNCSLSTKQKLAKLPSRKCRRWPKKWVCHRALFAEYEGPAVL
jgi:hypothetical protein